MKQSRRGHSLLEVIVATGIFILVAVALAGVWVMYGKALAKSGEVIAANTVARSVTEGLSANGWIWLKARENDTFPADLTPVTVERIVRGRKADITYKVAYELTFNTGDVLFPVSFTNLAGQPVSFSPDLCKITVFVRWNSAGGGKISGAHNSEAVYSAYVYRHGL